MFNTLTARGKIILSLIIFVVACAAGYFTYQYFHTAHPVTGESQVQAETTQGIDLAAKNAHITLLQGQLIDALDQIKELKNKTPDTIIKTVPVEVTKVISQEVEKRGADFAIVTDPKNPDKQVDLKEIEKLPVSTDVTLNQYNVFAYKKVIRGINIYPDFSGVTPSGVSEVTGDISRRISKDGKYIGVTAAYNFKHDEVKAGVRFSF